MRRAVLAVVCAVIFTALPAPALAANGQLAAVAEGKLVAVNPDGSGLRTLWRPAGEITGLAWSPDGNKLVFSYLGKITIFDTLNKQDPLTSLPFAAGSQDLDPIWGHTGDRIGFRRVSPLVQKRMRVGLRGDVVGSEDIDLLTTTFAFSPSLVKWARRVGSFLAWEPGGELGQSSNAQSAPAWAPNDTDLAYVEGGGAYDAGLRVVSTAAPWTNTLVAPLPAANPAFSPDGTSLVYVANGELRTVRPGSAPVAVPGPVGVTSVAWQPCTNETVSCRSIAPPRCGGPTAQVTTQTDQPVEIVAPSCWDPLGQPLSLIVTLPPAHGTVTGTAYTPAPGFTGQDSVTFKVSNGSSESETIRVTIFVVPRPTPSATPPPSATVTATAPFLSLRARPRLNRKRVTVARLTCDQRCTFSVRLDGKVRVKKKTGAIKGAVLKRSLEPGQVLALRLKLPTKPAGTLKTAWITGTVRGATGAGRSVKLPVSVPR